MNGARAVWLLTALRFKRLANQISLVYNRRRGGAAAAPKARLATPTKGRNRWVVSGVAGSLMLLSYGTLTHQSIVNLHRSVDRVPGPHSGMPVGTMSDAMTRALTMELSLLVLVSILLSLAARELSQPDWDMEWLITLPWRLPALLWARLLERSFVNPAGVLTLWPAATLIAFISGCRWSAPFAGLLAMLPLLLLAGVARTLLDTGLRMSLAPSNLRNLQAVLSIGSVVLFYVVISLGMTKPMEFALNWARSFPSWGTWLPTGLMIRALNAEDPVTRLMSLLLLLAEVALILLVGVEILKRQLRDGVVGSTSRETGRRMDGAPTPRPTRAAWISSTVQRRELTLLGRDRNFLVQTLVLPLVIVFSQIIFQGRLQGTSVGTISNASIAAVAFGIAAYTLMMSAFQTLNSEGGALWLLYTVPRSLESILAEKAQLWAGIALVYPAAVFVIAAALRGGLGAELLGYACIVLLGVPIYAAIAVALGVFGCNPLSVEVRTKLRPTYVYLYLMLAGFYTYAIFTGEWSQKIVLIVLSGLLSLSLWQKARDEIPYLLDPAASPPARVSTSDGVIAAMVFFVVQGLITAVVLAVTHGVSGFALTLAYSSAGAAAYLLVRLVYWRSKTRNVPQILGARWTAALGWGAVAGLVAAVLGVLYLVVLARLGLQQSEMRHSASHLRTGLWIEAIAVIAAPLFEEFIFRGLIFGGLRRSWSVVPSVAASAAVFAIVHPPVSMLPVFCLGVCTAVAYDRTKQLIAPMLAHGGYNAVVIAAQLFMYGG